MFKLIKIVVQAPVKATFQEIKNILQNAPEFSKVKIDFRKCRFYKFGELSDSKSRTKDETYKMRLFKCNEDLDEYRKLEEEHESFPFLINDSSSVIDQSQNPFDMQIILVRFSNFEKCQSLTKPIQLPKKFSPLTIYQVIHNLCKKSFEDNYSSRNQRMESEFCEKSFEEHFGTKEKPHPFKAFPFVVELRNSNQSLVTDIYKEEEVELDEYHEILVHVRDQELKSLKNFSY